MTSAEASKVLGEPTTDVAPVASAPTSGCRYATADTKAFVYFYILKAGDPLQQGYGSVGTSVSGIGDSAYFVSATNQMILTTKVGADQYQIRVFYGAGHTPQPVDTVKASAIKALKAKVARA
jgi:hypothetical protein